MDPLPLTVRSLGLSYLPGLNYAFNAFFGVLDRAPSGFVQVLSGALQFLLKEVLLSFKQPFFRQGFFLGLIFAVILALNLRVTRLWCRALCPLGALLAEALQQVEAIAVGVAGVAVLVDLLPHAE